jgi:hypothetical protein
MLSKGEFVMNADATAKNRGALEAMKGAAAAEADEEAEDAAEVADAREGAAADADEVVDAEIVDEPDERSA